MNCPKCGKEMIRVEKSTMSGRDMRTYRCDYCGEDHIVDYGIALWKAMSDARHAEGNWRTEEESLQKKEVVRQRREGRTARGDNKFYIRVGVIVAVSLVAMIVLLSSLMR
jgi:CRISPR/Cas system type I-B associated protein Csh2 (Cas7 group RAMP superfamily)